jgi:hypothetical protein
VQLVLSDIRLDCKLYANQKATYLGRLSFLGTELSAT